MTKTKYDVLIAEDHPLYRKAITSVLRKSSCVNDIYEADNGLVCLKHMRHVKIDVVFLDIQMPKLNGIETLKIMMRDYPKTKVIVLTQFDEPRYVNTMTSLGVNGYLLKSSTEREILDVFDRIVNEGEQIIHGSTVFEADLEDYSGLGRREIEVLTLMCQGLSSREIADTLFISLNTVHNHRKSIKKKLKANSLPEIINWAREHKLI